jgi:hypothetical protein
MESNAQDADELATLIMLEGRLHRLEFLLHGLSNTFGIPGPSPIPATATEPVSTRLASLESGLRRLASRHGLIQDLLDLRMDSSPLNISSSVDKLADTRYPDLFVPANNDHSPSTLDHSVIKSIVLAHASSFPETVSRLNSVKDLPIPPASASAELLALGPRLEKAIEVQESQLHDVAALRTRSARLLERWLEVGVVGQGEVWAEWEERVRGVERSARRIEVAREKQGR